jgi:hypothetical protein
MSRIIDEQYFEDTELSYRIRIGEISKPNVKHSDHNDYDLTKEETIRTRIRYLDLQEAALAKEYNNINKEFLSGTRPYGFRTAEHIQVQMDKIEKSIMFNRALLEDKQTSPSYDIESTAKIPLDQITEILPSGFFRDNPFRTEASPSNSLHWDKKSNRWTDFASGESGDVIDLFRAINSCDLPEALKALQQYL